jgi:ribonuclease T2
MLKRTLAAGMLITALATAGQAGYKMFSDDPSDSRNVPGVFDYYTLVLSWSPTHCATAERGGDDTQCARDDGARFGFVLHGLWPQYEQGYPERCFTRWKPFVPDQVISSVADIMPNKGLVIHEYREHGTCSGLRPEPFFALARRAFTSINIPQRYRNPYELQFVSPRDVMAEFLSANPQLRPDMLEVTCDGSALRDVRVCLTKEGRPRSCGLNERKGGACRADPMRIPPVRSTKWDYENNRAQRLKPAPADPQIFHVPLH